MCVRLLIVNVCVWVPSVVVRIVIYLCECVGCECMGCECVCVSARVPLSLIPSFHLLAVGNRCAAAVVNSNMAPLTNPSPTNQISIKNHTVQSEVALAYPTRL